MCECSPGGRWSCRAAEDAAEEEELRRAAEGPRCDAGDGRREVRTEKCNQENREEEETTCTVSYCCCLVYYCGSINMD